MIYSIPIGVTARISLKLVWHETCKSGELKQELFDSQNREIYKIYADLISANLHNIARGVEKVELDIYDKDRRKQFIGKVQRFSKILKQFNGDQLTYIQSCMNEIANKSVVDVEYILPEQVCPHCGETIPEEPATAQSLLFTRHQLALLANS